MPYADPEVARRKRREKYLRWKRDGTKKRHDERYREKHRAELRADFNERHWRMRFLEAKLLTPYEHDLLFNLSQRNEQSLADPVFTVIQPDGSRRRERLSEPLPAW